MQSQFIILAAFLIGAYHPADAQESLYGRQPPPGSAFLRLANATAVPVSITINNQPDASLGTGTRVTPYTVIEHPTNHPISITARGAGQDRHLTYTAAADGYVSIVVQQDEVGIISLAPIVDKVDFNQSRARLAFYNTAAACGPATIATDPGGDAVFKAVAPGTTIARTVNPVEGRLKAQCGKQISEPTVRLGGMQAGSSYSLWLIPAEAGTSLFMTTDTMKPYKP